MNIPSNITTLIAGILLTLFSLWYGQNHGLLPLPASAEAPLVDGLFNTMMTIATGIFLLVQGTIIVAAIRFRHRAGDETDGPPVHGNVPLEILWTAIPVVIVLGISVYSFEVYDEMGGLDQEASNDHHMTAVAHVMQHPGGAAIAAPMLSADDAIAAPDLPPAKSVAVGIGASPGTIGSDADLVVDVEALQFAWIFKYPNPNSDMPIYSGSLYLPAGREVQLNIVAKDVLHAFWVPEFRLKQDAIPGREAELRFVPEQLGSYSVVCAELCGSYHGGMRTQAIVQSPEEFDSWYQSQQQVASQSESNNAIATLAQNASASSKAQLLNARAQELGIDDQMLEQLYPEAVSAHSHHAAAIANALAAS